LENARTFEFEGTLKKRVRAGGYAEKSANESQGWTVGGVRGNMTLIKLEPRSFPVKRRAKKKPLEVGVVKKSLS